MSKYQALPGRHYKNGVQLENLLLCIGEPLIEWHFGGHRLELPLSHKLPLYMREYPQYSRNLGRIAACVSEKYADLRVVDVGANIGDLVAIARDLCGSPILCIEGAAGYTDLLKRKVMQFADVEVIRAYLGERTMIENGLAINVNGTGSLNISAKGSAELKIMTLD